MHPDRLDTNSVWVDLPVPVSTEVPIGTLLGVLIQSNIDASYAPNVAARWSLLGLGITEPLLVRWSPGQPFLSTNTAFLICDIDVELITDGTTVTQRVVLSSVVDVGLEDGTTLSAHANPLGGGVGP